jgi:hypothetical protein
MAVGGEQYRDRADTCKSCAAMACHCKCLTDDELRAYLTDDKAVCPCEKW